MQNENNYTTRTSSPEGVKLQEKGDSVPNSPKSPSGEELLDNNSTSTGDDRRRDSAKMSLTTADDDDHDHDTGKVKFTNANSGFDGTKNGEAKVDIEKVPVAFAGMGKEELMKFANDPFWVRLRWGLFILFWLGWVAMLAGAIVLIVLAPRCAPVPTLDWWQKSVVYQVHVRSFQDSNDDGVGDLKGIESRLDYFETVGVETLMLSAFYKKAMGSFDTDVEDFKQVDPAFGSMEDFESLVKSMKAKGLKLVLDFIPNHNSKQSVWFNKSRNHEEPFTDYYIWVDGKGADKTLEPNNWVNVYGDPAWTYDDQRKQFYFHQYLPQQPDLNLRNEVVLSELRGFLTFWLEKGVDGFNVEGAEYLFEDENLTDELGQPPIVVPGSNNRILSRVYATNQPETFELLANWTSLLNAHSEKKEEPHKLLIVNVDQGLNATMEYYGKNSTQKLADFPINLNFAKGLTRNVNGANVFALVRAWLDYMPNNSWPNWILGNENMERISSRMNPDLLDGLHMITMLLPGTQLTYYGDEIGMKDVPMSLNETQDPANKHAREHDGARSPMQWSSDANAGFSSENQTLTNLHPNYGNVSVQSMLFESYSHLKIYQDLIKLRKQTAMTLGSLSFLPELSNDGSIFAFSRVKRGSPGYVVLVNFGGNKTMVDLARVKEVKPYHFALDQTSIIPYKFPDDGNVEIRSSHIGEGSMFFNTGSKAKVSLHGLQLLPNDAIVIKFVPSFPDK